MELMLPVQAAVDRSELLDVYLVSILTHDNQTGEPLIRKEPVGGPYGSLPGDPAAFTPGPAARRIGGAFRR
jgi:hypothetical protein